MGIVIGIVNQKGGVGKTTTSVNLAAAISQTGKKVLLIDMDPQGNMTTHLGIGAMALQNQDPNNSPDQTVQNINTSYEEDFNEPSIYEVLKGQKDIKEAIIERSPNLFVVPASLLLSAADLELGGVVGRELILKRALSKVKGDYDAIIIDCPPALGLLSLNALAASEKIIIPVQSEFLALHGVRQLLDTIDKVREIYNPDLVVGGVLICLHDNRKRLARAVADTIRSYFGELVYTTVIRDNVALAEAPSNGQTIFEYSAKSPGAEDYLALAKEALN